MRVPWDRGGIRWCLIFLGLVAGRPSPTTILAGVPLLLLGTVIHLWAKGCLHQNGEVTASGPYRYVRHPFYLGNLIIDVSTVIMSGSLLLACVFPLWWVVVYLPVMRREEAAMVGRFGEEYRAYARRVPSLFPTARPLAAVPGFSWRNPNILQTEVPRALRFLSYPFLFALAYEWRTDDLLLLPPVTPLALCALLIIVSAYVASWQVKRIAAGGA